MPGLATTGRPGESINLDAEISSPFLDTNTVTASHPAILNDPHSTRVDLATLIDVCGGRNGARRWVGHVTVEG